MNEREIFIGVLQEESLAAQQAFLDNACGSNAELRRRVEGLLRDREKDADFQKKNFGNLKKARPVLARKRE
jgi:hypothetical protein